MTWNLPPTKKRGNSWCSIIASFASEVGRCDRQPAISEAQRQWLPIGTYYQQQLETLTLGIPVVISLFHASGRQILAVEATRNITSHNRQRSTKAFTDLLAYSQEFHLELLGTRSNRGLRDRCPTLKVTKRAYHGIRPSLSNPEIMENLISIERSHHVASSDQERWNNQEDRVLLEQLLGVEMPRSASHFRLVVFAVGI